MSEGTERTYEQSLAEVATENAEYSQKANAGRPNGFFRLGSGYGFFCHDCKLEVRGWKLETVRHCGRVDKRPDVVPPGAIPVYVGNVR